MDGVALTANKSANVPHGFNKKVAVVNLFLTMFLFAMDATSVSTALPAISDEFSSRSELAPWIISAFLATSTATAPLYGKLADVVGRRRTFMAAQMLFVIGQAGSALSPSMILLIFARAVQGLGAGGIMSLANIIMADFVTPRARGKFAAAFGGDYAFGALLGPVLGGIVSDRVSWRLVFAIPVPLGVIALLLTGFFYRGLEPEVVHQEKLNWHTLDVIGASLCLLSVACMLTAVTIAGDQYEWEDVRVIMLVFGFAFFATMFVINEWKWTRNPILPLVIFRNRTLAVASIISCAVGAGMYCATTFSPAFFVFAQGTNSTEAGIRVLPVLVSFVLTSVVAGLVASKTGNYVWFPRVGTLCGLMGAVMLAQVGSTTHYGYIAPAFVLVGAGLGFNIHILVIAVQNACEDAEFVSPSTVALTFFRSLSGALAIAFFAAIMDSQAETGTSFTGGSSSAVKKIEDMDEAERAQLRESIADGIAEAWYLIVAVMAIALIASAFLPKIRLRKTAGSFHTTTEGSQRDIRVNIHA
jgi:MFS family permease